MDGSTIWARLNGSPSARSRRGLLRALAGGAVASRFPGLGPSVLEAKKCKKRGKKKRCRRPAPSGVAFAVEAGVSAEDEAYVREGIRLAQDFVAAALGLTLAVPITVRVLAGTGSGSPPAVAGARRITIRAAHPVWTGSGALQRTKIVVHEFVHLVQEFLCQNRAPGPIWLLEGTAEYLAYLAVAEKGLVPYEAVRDAHYGGVEFNPDLDLSAMETVQGFAAADQACCAYALTPLAAELLTADRGLGAIADYYRRLGRGEGAVPAFAAAFGVALADFYADFAAAQAGFAQQDPTHPGLRYPVTFADSAADVTIEGVSTPLARGTQGVLRATTAPSLRCTLSVTSSQAQPIAAAPAHADPAGNLFWLFTVGKDAAPGTATAEVRCGADPDAVAVEMT